MFSVLMCDSDRDSCGSNENSPINRNMNDFSDFCDPKLSLPITVKQTSMDKSVPSDCAIRSRAKATIGDESYNQNNNAGDGEEGATVDVNTIKGLMER